MGWLDEQIKQRMESDRHMLEDSFFRMAGVVMDKWDARRLADERLIANEAIDDVLKYYHQKPVEIPDHIREVSDQLEYALRPSGLMVRDVELTEGWQRNAFGPMLGYMKGSGATVALLPGTVSGYWYRDPATGRKKKVTRKTAALFSRDAICFYQPLPMKKLGVPDLILYMKNSLSHGDLVLILLVTLAVTLLGMIEPRVYHLVTGKVLKSRNLNLMAGMGMFLLAGAFASGMIGLARSLLMERINVKTSMAVEASVMMRILSLPVSFFRRFSSGEMSERASSVSSLCGMMLNSIFNVGLSSIMSLMYISQIFRFASALVLPSVLIILATVSLSVATSLAQIRVTRKMMRLEAEETNMNYAILSGIQKIRLSGSENRVFARWGKLYADRARLQYDPPLFLRLNGVFTTALSLAGTILMYYLAVKAGVTENQYYAFSAAYGRLMGAFSALAGIAISAASVKPVLEMAEPILKAEPEVAEEKQAVGKLTGHIEVSHVSFRYDENTPYVLRDLSLNIKAGEYVAIVGRTGCGKSTLVRLLLGFEKPENGAIFYDRHDMNSLDPRSLRRNIGVVIQNGQLFQGDIFSNITISAPHLTMDDAWEAAETAGIARDIREMPMGMFTVISEGQGGISGGQKQRLMIARAVAPRPKILIFDEATSALDNQTQKQVSDALEKLRCTRIVIAHRLSTVRCCDRILVMENGAIIEEGKYDDLIARGGCFAELVARQRLDV